MSTDDSKLQAGDARPCKACGMPIEGRPGPDGRLLPLQRVRSVYVLNDPLHGGEISNVTAIVSGNAEGVFVSHFETCPNASAFAKARKG